MMRSGAATTSEAAANARRFDPNALFWLMRNVRLSGVSKVALWFGSMNEKKSSFTFRAAVRAGVGVAGQVEGPVLGRHLAAAGALGVVAHAGPQVEHQRFWIDLLPALRRVRVELVLEDGERQQLAVRLRHAGRERNRDRGVEPRRVGREAVVQGAAVARTILGRLRRRSPGGLRFVPRSLGGLFPISRSRFRGGGSLRGRRSGPAAVIVVVVAAHEDCG